MPELFCELCQPKEFGKKESAKDGVYGLARFQND
jgi:hypothetical protein